MCSDVEIWNLALAVPKILTPDGSPELIPFPSMDGDPQALHDVTAAVQELTLECQHASFGVPGCLVSGIGCHRDGNNPARTMPLRDHQWS
eukprot:6103394-Amphidinium_carterae.1